MNTVWLSIASRCIFIGAITLLTLLPSEAARLKDIANIKGVRDNILIGYGIVVGLKGSGDSSAEVTGKSLARFFGKLGLDTSNTEGVSSKNAAAVIVTAKLPPFARVGNKIDVTVSSIGDASSLEGGILLVTPLKAGDQNVYAVAQGAVSLGSAIGEGDNFPTVGRVVSGATIERDLDLNFAAKKSFRLSLNEPDFTTAARLVALINGQLGGKFATARDSGTLDVVVPFSFEGNAVNLWATLENLQVNVDSKAKVVLNERTGTVVMGGMVAITPVAISHGELSIEVAEQKDDRAPAAGGGAPGGGEGETREEKVFHVKGASVSDLVKALNTMGVSPKDLTAIFQTLRRTGALQAELEIM